MCIPSSWVVKLSTSELSGPSLRNSKGVNSIQDRCFEDRYATPSIPWDGLLALSTLGSPKIKILLSPFIFNQSLKSCIWVGEGLRRLRKQRSNRLMGKQSPPSITVIAGNTAKVGEPTKCSLGSTRQNSTILGML